MEKLQVVLHKINSNLKRSGIKRIIPIFVLLICLLVPISCNREESRVETAGDKDTGIHKSFERGPVTVTLDVDKKEITIADRLNLLISVIADEDYEIELPGFGEKLEQFGIIDYQTTQPELVENNRKKISRSYILEPFLSGDYTIPPMKILFRKRGKKEADSHEIETEQITVMVKSLLPEAKADLKLHDIKPPVELPRSPAMWIWAGIGAAIVGVGVIAVIVVRGRRRAEREAAYKRVLPHELAYRELEELVSQNLLEKGEIKNFYQHVSSILRRYIENRFGLHAPEQTTQEFLVGIETGDRLPGRYNPLLRTFLLHCDLVKFAEHQPTTDDIQKTFDSCKTFISETIEQGVNDM